MSHRTISVVTSVYNGAKYLRSSLESVLSQKEVDFEVIAVDDGSTDESPAVLGELSRRDPRLRVFRQENQGLTRALIRGCTEARGEFIARHDCDDLSLPGRLARQAERLQKVPKLSMVSCATWWIGPDGEMLAEVDRPENSQLATDLLLNHWRGPTHGSVMFRKSCYLKVGGYRSQFYFAQDSDLWLRLGEVGPIAYDPDFLYAFRVIETSMSPRYRKMQQRLGELGHECQAARREDRSEAEILARAALIRPDPSGRIRDDQAAGAYFIARCLLKRRDPRARAYLLKVLSRRPWKLKAWASLVPTWVLSRYP